VIDHYRFSAGEFSCEFAQFTLTGSDVVSFLQSQSTFDIRELSPLEFHLTSFLDPQGRAECYGWLLSGRDVFTYLVPLGLKNAAEERLNRFLISEDVEIKVDDKVTWHFVVGEEAYNYPGYQGELFADKSILTQASPKLSVLSKNDSELWRKLSGWPSFDGSDFQKEIINNNRLFDLSVSSNKGCYPGQETVSKIATRRGSAYAPVLIETNSPAGPGTMIIAGGKMGTITDHFIWSDHHYLMANVLRDFRVEKMKVSFELNGQNISGIIRYYPLLEGTRSAKASDLFHLGTDDFKHDELKDAESKLRRAIKIDPTFADAYESLGVMLGRQERFDEAIELMRKLSEVDPDSVLAHTNLSLYLMKQGKIEEAEEEKSKATLKSFKHFGNEAKLKQETEEKKKKQQSEWAQREGMFRQVLEIDPDDTLANYGLGSIAVEKQEWQTAREHLEKVLAADPKYSVAYLALGKALLGLGEKEKAKEIFSSGIKVAAAKGDLMPANQMQSELDRLSFS
jgi:folate-binding Fe-S cluster repair protein YgfZ/Tfp pilus assembly protein PilF